jgi:hypothetical protein
MAIGAATFAQFVPVIAACVAATVALISVIYQRKQERLAVNRAILAEVSRLLAVVRRHREWWDGRRASGDIRVPLLEFSTTVYDKLTDKLGLIHPEHIATVVSFYGFVKFVNAVQPTRESYKAADQLETFARFYSKVLGQVTEYGPFLDHAFKRYGVCAPDDQPVLGTRPRAARPDGT